MKLDEVDPLRLARIDKIITETEPIADFPRLLEALADSVGQAEWSAAFSQQGSARSSPVQLKLTGQAQCNVPCVRCLAGLPMSLNIDRDFELVTDESVAAKLDAQDNERDVIAAPAPWDLAELVEEEFLLALPLMPRHENCEIPAHAEPDDSGADSGATERQFPFADLASKIKGGSDEPDKH